MRRALPSLLLLGAAGPALALDIRPMVEARLRYEHAAVEGAPADSDALTLRVRAGAVATEGAFSALVEAQGNLAVAGTHFDGITGNSALPLIADPQDVGITQALLRYKAGGLVVSAGRQRIALDDERFVGGVAFRQNGQSFDSVRLELTPVKGLKADLGYVWRVRTIWGVDGTGVRPASVRGDTLLANVGWASPIGQLTGFAYLLEQDDPGYQAFRLSSQTYGVRLQGHKTLGGVKLGWLASHARQTNYRRNPNDYSAAYWLADVSADFGGPRIGAGYEVLGADDGRAFTSFQTPLGTNFKFQGWADKFLTTPPDGVRDLYASAGWGTKAIGPAKAVQVQAVWHRFESDRLARHYGNELDLLASARFGRTTASVRYADYDADLFATDTRRLWLQLDWTI